VPDDHCQVAITWAPEGKRKIGRPKVNWRRTAETERNSIGWSSWNQARQVSKTGRSGNAALKPYVPTDTKKKGEGEVTVKV